ncbi:hypothetical protein COO60DRAFT_1505098 [Scenedesmus sp. NREL 46B-D3]|nr:hypothetical protein COO60DRAFT_1505098 [Scenedesmus sp. NREL 46B-D3]
MVREDVLLGDNWERVKEVNSRLQEQAAASTAAAYAAADTAGPCSAGAADDEVAAAREDAAAAEEAAAALATLAGSNGSDSSLCSNTAEVPAGEQPVRRDTSQLHTGTQQLFLQPQQQQFSSIGTTSTCSLTGSVAGCNDAGSAAGASGSQPADTAAATTAVAQPAAPAGPPAAASKTSALGLGAAAVAAAATAPGCWSGAAPILGWVPPTKEYANSNADMQRLWREHQLNLKVLAVVLHEQPEALVLLQRVVDFDGRVCAVGAGKARQCRPAVQLGGSTAAQAAPAAAPPLVRCAGRLAWTRQGLCGVSRRSIMARSCACTNARHLLEAGDGCVHNMLAWSATSSGQCVVWCQPDNTGRRL